MVGQFARVQVAKGKGTIGVYNRLHVNFPYFLEFARIKGVLREKVAGSLTFHMPFLEAGVGFFNGFNLLLAELFALGKVLFFQLEKPLVTAPQSMALHDFLNSRLGAVFAFQFQELLNVAASFLRVLGNQFQDALFYFGRCGLRVCFMNGWQVSQSFKALFSEPFTVFIELSG